jgi:hypothetical protein
MVGQARSGCQPHLMMLHICKHAQSRLAFAFSMSMGRAVNASLNPRREALDPFVPWMRA